MNKKEPRFLMEITNSCEDWEWEDSLSYLQEILNGTRIKEGFMEIHKGGWRRRQGYTEPFEMTSENLLDKLGDFEWTLRVYKKGHRVFIIRTSHDEPTGALINVLPMKEYKRVVKEVMGE